MTRPPEHSRGVSGDGRPDDRPDDAFQPTDHAPADHDQARLLDAALDDLHRSPGAPGAAATTPAGLDPALAATARQVRATLGGTPSRLRPTDKDLIWEDLMRSHASPASVSVRPVAATATSLPLPPPARPATAADRARSTRSARSTSAVPAPVRPYPLPAPRSRSTPGRRWLRHGWPAVELLGAAALILGIVAVIIGATGGDGPPATRFAGVGVGTAEATPAATPAETAPAVAALPDPGNTGVMPGPGPVGQPELIWRVPVAQGGSIFVGNDLVVRTRFPDDQLAIPPGPSSIEARTARAGTVAWDTEIQADSVSISAIWQDIVLVNANTASGSLAVGGESVDVDASAYLLGLDANDGSLRWSLPLVDESTVNAAIIGPTVTPEGIGYASLSQGSVVAIDLLSGTVRWTNDIRADGSPVTSFAPPGVPSVADGLLTVFSPVDGQLVGFDAASGDRLWEREIIDPDHSIYAGGEIGTSVLGPVMADGRIFFSLSNYTDADRSGDQSLIALDAATGEPIWDIDLAPIDLMSFERPYGVSQPYVSGDVVAISTGSEGTIAAYSADTGDPLWDAPLGESSFGLASIADDTMYVAAQDGSLTALDLATGEEQWSLATGGQPGTPFVIDGVIYLSSQDGNLYAIGGDGSADSAPATPAAATNISGQPTCDVTPRPGSSRPPVGEQPSIPTAAEIGTPAATLVDAGTFPGDTSGILRAPTLAWPELPVGTPADADTIAGIAETVDVMTVCGRTGDLSLVAAAFTDDYFRRPYVVRTTAYGNALPSSEIPVMSGDVRLLDDGRAAMVVTEGLISREIGQNQATLWVFAEQPDGRWLVDEVIILNDSGEAPQG